MANNFTIEIQALDRFSKTFRDLNNKAAKAVRPLSNVQRQVGALSRELHLDKLAKGMEKVSFASFRIAKSVGVVGPQMEALFGVGLAGGIVGIGAGIAGLTVNFGRLGFQVGRTSSLIGIGIRDLQELEGAAKLAGVSTTDMDASLNDLANTLEGAKFRRQGEAFAMMKTLGIPFRLLSNGAIDVKASLSDLSEAMKNANPQVRQLIASTFHLEKLLPMLNGGSKGLQSLVDEFNKFGYIIGPDGIKKADAMTQALNRLKVALEGNAVAAGLRFAPAMTKALNAATAFINGDSKSKAAPAVDHWREVDASRRYTWDAIKRGDWRALFGRDDRGGARGASGTWTPDPVGIRWNNPGNLRNPNGIGFQTFASAQQGLNKAGWQLSKYFNRDHLDTISEIVNKWAPAADHNNVPAYIADVTGQTGFGAEQHLNLNDPKVMAPLLSAMVKHEQGRQPFAASDYAQVASQNVKVEVAFANAPAGTTAKAKGPGNAFVPTRVSYVMPTTEMP